MNYTMEQVVPDAIASLVLLTFIGYVGAALFGAATLSIPAVWATLYATIVLMSAVKLYGKKTLTAVREAGGKVVQVQSQKSRST